MMGFTLFIQKTIASSRLKLVLHSRLELILTQFALFSIDYTFNAAVPGPRDKESFGLDNRGRMMLVPIEKLPELVAKMNEIYGVSS